PCPSRCRRRSPRRYSTSWTLAERTWSLELRASQRDDATVLVDVAPDQRFEFRGTSGRRLEAGAGQPIDRGLVRQRPADLAVQSVDDAWRRPRRREDRVPVDDREVGVAALGDGRYVGRDR